MRYLRHFFDSENESPDELSEADWIDYARGNVYNLDVALKHGFRTPNADYWTERQ